MSALAKMAATGGGIVKTYVDDVFSTYTYSGNGGTQNIINGLDLAGRGGLVWVKARAAVASHYLLDTIRGVGNTLSSDSYYQQSSNQGVLTSFNSDGFTLGSSSLTNQSGVAYVSWAFREAKKFLNIVYYTGAGTDFRPTQVVPHNLGTTPGWLIVKKVDNSDGYWLCSTAAGASADDTSFSVSSRSLDGKSNFNDVGVNYIAYLFAHDPSPDGLIQCGTFTTDSSGNASVNLGWEPQFVWTRPIQTTGDWLIQDNMRGFPAAPGSQVSLSANTSAAEVMGNRCGNATATGFNPVGLALNTQYMFMAIRRPNKPPTSGTQVYKPVSQSTVTNAFYLRGVGFAPDFVLGKGADTQSSWAWTDKLRGATKELASDSQSAEAVYANDLTVFDSDGIAIGYNSSPSGRLNQPGTTTIYHFFKRAPGFLDTVCYKGTGLAHTEAHGLGVVPELIITKSRSSAWDWVVYAVPLGVNKYLFFYTNGAASSAAGAGYTSVANTNFGVGVNSQWNASGDTYVSYLFASLAGVSKVGSYTGNGASQVINCGFSAGARFILIKRTDTSGEWYMWNSARGIVAANDPFLLLDGVTWENTTNDSVDPDPSGFAINQNATTNINVLNGNYIYLAIA